MPSEGAPAADLRRGLWRRFLQIGLLFAVLTGLLLGAAGHPDWFWAWIYIGVYLIGTLVNSLLLLRRSPETIVERGKAAEMVTWDRWVGGLWGSTYFLALPMVAGLDQRLGWSGDLPLAIHLAGLGCFIAGFALFGWALVENAFFATVARLQRDRGQRVCSSGPYRLVRHPGYLGALLQCLAVPLVLGSLWALLPGFAAAALMVLRTFLEDRMLSRDLEGYRSYLKRVTYRLLPGIW